MTIHVPDATLVWGLFVRALGVIYLIATAQLYHQVVPLAGRRGLTPIAQKLKHIQIDYPGWRRFVYFPTLLWLNTSDHMLKGMVLAGSGGALLVIYGGPYALLGLLVCWLVYQSFDIAVGMTYPWDCLLLEAGFLALFLPALPALPHIALLSAPVPVVAWAYRWLFFRVLFGFGKYKFIGGNLRDTGYFRSFMVNIPLPTYMAWYAYRLPRWVFQVILLVVFLSEIVLPFGVFITGDGRVVVALVTATLMIGIQLVSNFGFFNMLTIVLCLTLLDRSASVFDTSLALMGAYPVTHVIMGVLALGGLVNLPFNSWCTFTWFYWPSLMAVRLPGIQPLLKLYRGLSRFRIVHAYGVFPPTSSPPIRWVPVVEGTRDGRTWLPYEYRYTPTHETSPPRFVAPYHPRFDHSMFYESFGTNDANFVWSTIGAGNPYDLAHSSAVKCLLQRLLEGEPSVHKLFRSIPFRAGERPVQVRMTLYRFQPVTPAERRQTGHWWHKTAVGVHLPAASLNNQVLKKRWSVPDNFHPDALIWRRRSPRMRALLATGEHGPLEQLWTAATAGLTVGLAEFWSEWIESIQNSGKVWADMPDVVARLRTRYTPGQLEDLETLLNRLTLLLLARMDNCKERLELPVSEQFQRTLFAHHIIAKGQSAYMLIWQNSTEATKYVTDFTAEDSLYYLGVLWFDTLVYQARKFRLALQVSEVKSGNGLPGFLELVPFLSQQFYDPAVEQLPAMHRNPANGEWTISEPEPIQYQTS